MVRKTRAIFFTLINLMEHYIQIEITSIEESDAAIAIAELSEIGFDGFLEEEKILKAYCKESDLQKEALNNLMNRLNLSYSLSILKNENWNTIWEANFSPVQVDDFVGIRASFHEPMRDVQHELVITPKMSFGTGHHATTFTVMQLMRSIDFNGKKVFDFGTGTGILAILAEKLGAEYILAVDNDDWCIENASENTSINQCKNIEIQKVDKVNDSWRFDVVIANINRHIIEANLSNLSAVLLPHSTLILSGLLQSDEMDILSACKLLGLHHQQTSVKDSWIAIYLTKE
jgi:ribosomal protein L11 methyltransferase